MIKLTEEDFKMIYDTHFDNLRRYLYYRSGDQDLSEDIAQNVFMKIWKKKIDATKGNIKSLLFKVWVNQRMTDKTHILMQLKNPVKFYVYNEIFIIIETYQLL